jgi:DNA-binding NtrC family response regulator
MTAERRTKSVTVGARVKAGAVFCEVLSGTGVQARHLLPADGACTAGSDARVEIVISEATVSRRHASFEVKAAGVRVRDLGSRNGTWFLGAGVTEALVPFGATVRLGKALVRFAAEASATQGPAIEGLVGASEAMLAHRAQLQRAASVDAPVLLRGETGSGKEAAARALHAASRRRAGPFIVFEATSSELLDSQLFGHRKGAFTGATENRAGAVELADHGTLFLDEVGELPPDAQVRLLRVLETHQFTRLGDTAPRASDFRLVSATQHDLEALVKARRFREDLYFRLAVVVIDVPPLRARAGDVRLLAERFAAERRVTLDGATLAAWETRAWRGNLRELANEIERYHLQLSGRADASAPAVPRAKVMGEVERSLLVAALEQHGFDVAKASAQLGLSRSQTYRQMQRHGIEPRRRGRSG